MWIPAANRRQLSPGLGFGLGLGRVQNWMGGMAAAFDPSTLEGTLFVSITDGNDADSGLTEALAKETIAGVEAVMSANEVITFNYGDEWGEQLDTTSLNGIKLIPYGNDSLLLPVISGMDVITGWTLVAAATYSYEKSVTHGIGNAPPYNNILVAEIDESDEVTTPLGAYNYLKPVADAATCESTTGSYYVASPLTGTDNIMIHPSDDGNPNSNGKRYEVTIRESCVENFAETGLVVYKMLLKGSGDGVGQIYCGEDTWLQQCMFVGGGVHQVVMKSGVVDQCVFGHGPSGIPDSIKLVFYAVDAGGLECILKNSIIYNDGQNAFYTHNSLGTGIYRYQKITIQNVKIFGAGIRGQIITGHELIEFIVDGCYIDQGNKGIEPGTPTTTIKNTVIKDANNPVVFQHPSNPYQTIIIENCLIIGNDSSSGINTPELIKMSNPNINLEIRNCIIWSKSTYSGSQNYGITTFGNGSSNYLNVHNCIIIGDVPSGKATKMVALYDRDSGVQMINGEFEDNIYILLSGDFGAGIEWTSANPSNNVDFQSWQETSDQDQNSFFFDFLALGLTLDDFFEDPSNGDWRVIDNAYGCAAISLGAGMTTPITEYPTEPTKDEAYAKMLDGSLVTETLAFTPATDTNIAATTWIAAGSFSAGQQTIINDFVDNLKTGLVNGTNVWNALIILDLYIWGDATNNGINGKDPGTNDPVFIGSPTHGASGVSLNASSQYIQLGVITSEHLLDHEITISTWLETNQSSVRSMGAFVGTGESLTFSVNNSGYVEFDTYNTNSSQGRIRAAISDSSELVTACRRSATEAEVYRNGTSLGAPTMSGGGAQTEPSIEVYSGGRNNSGSIQYVSTADVKRLDMIARKMSHEQAQDWNAAVQQLMTDLGI